MLKIFMFLSIVCLLASCSLDPAIIDKNAAEIPIAVSLLCPERQGVEVYVARSFPELRNETVTNALVSIVHGSESIHLPHVQNGLYRSPQYRIRHGERYDLYVRMENGKVLTGTTHVPQELRLKSVQPGDTLWFEKEASMLRYFFTAIGPEISWDNCQNAAIYLCYFMFADSVEGQDQIAVSTAETFVRTKLTFYHHNPNGDGVVVNKPIRQAKLALWAMDSSFYQNGGQIYSEYFRNIAAPDFIRPGLLPNRSHWQTGWSNIINGSGVFGAYTFAAQEVVVALKEPY